MFVNTRPVILSPLISKKHTKLSSLAHNIANKSTMVMHHGCVCARGNKVVSSGYNHYRNRFSDLPNQEFCSCHAEMDALRKLKKQHQKKGTSQLNLLKVV